MSNEVELYRCMIEDGGEQKDGNEERDVTLGRTKDLP